MSEFFDNAQERREKRTRRETAALLATARDQTAQAPGFEVSVVVAMSTIASLLALLVVEVAALSDRVAEVRPR